MGMSDVEMIAIMTRTVLDMEVEGVRLRGTPKLYGYHQKRYEEEWAERDVNIVDRNDLIMVEGYQGRPTGVEEPSR